jgi:uncharacterized Fe-S center protein
MGLASRSGKLDLHASISPKVKKEDCESCETCIKECPAGAISFDSNKKAEIDKGKCIGCAHCISICEAIKIPWSSVTSSELMERIDEYAKGILKEKKVIFINILKNITKDCDCFGIKQEKQTEDLGYLYSDDIVSAEQASFDLLKETFKKIYPAVDIQHQVDYAEEIGLGSRKYELIKLGEK